MKGLTSLFIGIFATFAFSWAGLVLVPNYQIGHLNPQTDEDMTDVYPMPQSGMVERGRKIYMANGCFYCHTQQVRPDYESSDIDRKWGDRRSAPRDYIFQHPVLLGRMRMGPDLSNLGKRAPAEDEAASPPTAASPAAAASPAVAAASPATSPAASPAANAAPSPEVATSAESGPAPYSAAWQHLLLYSPSTINLDSNMPPFRFLYEKRRISGERSADALELTGADAPPAGFEVVPSYEAKCLVAYLMSLDQSHPLKEVKSAAAPAAAAAPAKK